MSLKEQNRLHLKPFPFKSPQFHNPPSNGSSSGVANFRGGFIDDKMGLGSSTASKEPEGGQQRLPVGAPGNAGSSSSGYGAAAAKQDKKTIIRGKLENAVKTGVLNISSMVSPSLMEIFHPCCNRLDFWCRISS